MQTNIDTVLEQIQALAKEKGWADVETTARLARDNAELPLLLTFPHEVNVTAFAQWLGNATTAQPLQLSLEALANDPLSAIAAHKVVVVIPCDHLLSGQDADTLTECVLTRHAHSYATALVNAVAVTDQEDFAQVKRMASRLLTPDAAPLTDVNAPIPDVYMWSQEPVAPFLAARVAGDMQALAAWLAVPHAADDEFHPVFVLNADADSHSANAAPDDEALEETSAGRPAGATEADSWPASEADFVSGADAGSKKEGLATDAPSASLAHVQTAIQRRQRQALHVLDLLDQRLEKERSANAPTAEQTRYTEHHRLARARSEMADLRQNLLRRLDSDADVLQQQIVASLKTLEADLLDGLRPYIDDYLFLPKHHADMGPRAQQVMKAYIEQGVQGWVRRMEQTLTTRGENSLQDAQALIETADWSVVNRVLSAQTDSASTSTALLAPRQSAGRTYPDALLRQLAQQELTTGGAGPSQAGLTSLAVGASPKPTLRNTLVSVAVGGIGLLLLGLPGLAVGVLSVTFADSRQQEIQWHDQVESATRNAIHAMIQEGVAHAGERTRNSLLPLRDRIAQTLTDLEQQMQRALVAHDSQSQNGVTTAAPSVEQQVRDWRSQILESEERH